ncbi:MAG: hypothetical protein ABUS79_06455 [Pseudomonadota bacterium]
MVRRIKRAAILVAAGLVVQFATAFHWTPLTFVLSTVLALPLVVLGAFLFLRAVWRNLRDKGAV